MNNVIRMKDYIQDNSPPMEEGNSIILSDEKGIVAEIRKDGTLVMHRSSLEMYNSSDSAGLFSPLFKALANLTDRIEKLETELSNRGLNND